MPTSEPEADPRTIDELVNPALIKPGEETVWDAAAALHWQGTIEVVHRVTSLCVSECPQEAAG